MSKFAHKTFGFVLKRFLPYKNTYTLFTLTKGKITIVPTQVFMRDRLSVGMIVSCTLEVSRFSSFLASNVEIINPLLFLNTSSIQWVHQLAEVCYYFLPREECHVDIFIFLQRLFDFITASHEETLWSNELIQYACFSYLFKLLGFMPEEELTKFISFFEQELFVSVDIQKKNAVEFLTKIINGRDILHARFMKSWVYECLLTHPYAPHFKTFGSLTSAPTIGMI